MKKVFYFLCCLLLLSCEKTYYGRNAPLVTTSYGIWKLEKIVSPSRSILANELGYEQLIQIEPNGSTHNFFIFKDKKLTDTYSFGRTSNEIDKKGKIYFEVNMGIKLVKIEIIPNSEGSLMGLVMSDFLYKSPAQADTLRFHYSRFTSPRNW
ncbi:hypothetical protein [Emticicia sp. C21]|uniref:hypothetical protein n=1 Tax=Emticicia sp. C21 TaxID=2302915 RepID=UPI000E3423A7|nr:hypothetical protein [Emticicia sp. C21]RFS18224.1 hypothetical protein D0T08_02965 [Emticicia sp. C21]